MYATTVLLEASGAELWRLETAVIPAVHCTAVPFLCGWIATLGPSVFAAAGSIHMYAVSGQTLSGLYPFVRRL